MKQKYVKDIYKLVSNSYYKDLNYHILFEFINYRKILNTTLSYILISFGIIVERTQVYTITLSKVDKINNSTF